jgi:hypothetical protein
MLFQYVIGDSDLERVDVINYLDAGADLPYNEVGKIPRGPLVWGLLRQSGPPLPS